MKLCGVLCGATRAANIQTPFPVALTLVMLALTSTTFAASRPNIILFVTDDQVKEELACYGGKVLTPHIDRLAREGLRFDNAHVPSTVCTPSRY
jgi:arylsulfatase A